MKRALRWLGAIALLVAALLAITIWAGLEEAVARPIERRLTVELPEWPGGARPIRIALLSDIHIGNRAMTVPRLEAIVAQVNAAHPDLVLLAGDFVVGHDATGAAANAEALTVPLTRLAAPLGVVAVLGNHDHWTSPDAVRAALARAGVTVLENQGVRRGPVTVLGVGDVFSGHDDLAQTVAAAAALGGAPIVLTHSPDLVHQLPAGFPLLLAGHTHCGQLVLPVIGAPLRGSPYSHWQPLFDARYRCGVIRDPGRTTVVTAGVGAGTVPLRLGAPPDFWLIEVGP
jgi:predicted MPP superfamily phosphohydrolase